MWWNRKEDMHMRGVATLLLLIGLILSNMFVFVNMAEGAVSTGNTASLITSSQRVHQNSTAYPSFGISATSTGTDRLSSITVRVYPVNGFTMGDLQTISRDATVSGIALYRDDGNVDDLLDPADTPVNASSTSVTSSGTYYTVQLSYGSESIPSSVSGQYHWILTFRTSTSIADGDIFYLSIPAGGILFSDSSSQPSVAVNTSSITCHHTFLYPLSTAPVIMGERGTPTSEMAVVGIAIDSGITGLEHLKSISFSVAQSLNISRLLAPLSTDPSTSGVALYRDNGSNTGDVFSSTDDWGITPQTVTYLSGRITLNFSTSATETLLPSVRTGRHEYFLVLRTPENLQDAVRYYLNFSTVSILVEGRTGEVRGLPCYTSSASVLTDSSPPSLSTATISITSTSGYFWAADTDGEGNDDRVYYNNLPGQGSGQFVTIRIRGYSEDNPDYMEGEPAFNQRPEGPKDDRDQTDQQITYRITSYGTVDNPLTVKLVDKAGHITFYNVSFLEDNTPPRINSTWIRENSPYIYGDNESREIFFRPEMPRPTPLYIEGRAWEPANESGLWMATFSEEGSLDRSPSEDLTPAEFSGMYLISSTSDSDSSPISVYVYDHVRNFVTLHYNYTNVTGRPEVSILNPLRGSTVSGTVTVSARVNSTAPIYSVKVSFDGGKSYREMYPWRGNEYRYTWDTFSSPEGVVVMVVRAEDVVNGVRSTGSWVRVDNYPLFCDIVSPSYGEALRGVEEIVVNTSSYATVVRAYVGNTLIAVKYTGGEERVVLPFDTRMVQDGTHTLRVKVWGLGNETTESTVTIMVDNTPPSLLSKGIIYPRGQTGLKRGDNATFLVRLQDNTSGVAEVEGNFISLGGGIKESFYDDGMHGDGGANDGIWATSEIKINATWAYHVIKVWVKDRAGNVLNFTWKVAVDNHPPLVERAEVLYPDQQIAAKWGDKVRIRAKVSEKTTPVYVSLVLDTSGSMQGEKISRLKEAARTFINYTRSIDYISIYRFTPYGTPLRVLNFTRMNTSGKARAIQIVNSLAANASTPIWDAIGSAVLYTLQNSKGASATVAITDGQDDILRGYPFEEASNTWCPWHNWTETRYVYRHLGKYMLETPLGPLYQWFDNPIYEYRRGLLRAPIPIFTIGLGLEHHSPPDYPRAPQRPLNNSIDNKYAYWAGESGTPEYNLWRIATTSAGGKYYYAPSASQLISIFRGIAYSLFSQDSPGKVTEVKIFSEILPGGELSLFDDGNHSDGDPGDGLFGSDTFTVRDPSTTIKTVSILVKDWAGNQNISSLDFVLDNLPPEMRWARVLYPEEQGYVADGQKISLLLNATDNGTGIVDITADMSSLGYLSKLHLTRVEGDNYTVNNITVISGGIPNGHYRVPIEVLDGAGNSVVQMVDVRVVNDHAAPEIYITKPLWGEVVGEILEIEAVILDESEILWANATLSGGDENITAGYLTQDGNVWRLQISTKFIPEGAYNLTVSAVDITRKVGISTAVRIYIDRGSPIIVVWSPHPGEVLKGTVWLNYTLQENNVLQANIIVDGGVVYPLTMRFNTRLLPDGPHRLTFQVTDIAGRTSKVDVDVIVDNTPPELSPIVPTFGEILEG
ncbi:MAG: VWA domain-containing protein, partial [Thermoplasmata archaeon]|nr:VWA domain-containing protein [Thermoplasmata archaeon]